MVTGRPSLPSSLLSFLGAGRHGTPGLNSGGSADSLGPASTPHLLETGSEILVRGDTLLLLGAEWSAVSLVEIVGAETTLDNTEGDSEELESVGGFESTDVGVLLETDG